MQGGWCCNRRLSEPARDIPPADFEQVDYDHPHALAIVSCGKQTSSGKSGTIPFDFSYRSRLMHLLNKFFSAFERSDTHRVGAKLAIAVCVLSFWGIPIASAQDTPTLTDLASATYRDIEESPITLVNGSWEGEPAVEGGASVPRVDLAPRFRVVADLTGDGRDDAIALLYYNFGGSGVFSYLAAVKRDDRNQLLNIATTEIGDRVQLRSAALDGGELSIETIEAGPNDGACCPGQKRRRVFAIEGNAFVERLNEDQGRLNITDLDESKWRLIQWSHEESVAEKFEINIRFDDDRIYGSSGCNRYKGTIEVGEFAGDFSVVAPLASTRMACSSAINEAEERYMGALQKVQHFRFAAGELVLDWSDNNKWGSLSFEKVESQPE